MRAGALSFTYTIAATLYVTAHAPPSRPPALLHPDGIHGILPHAQRLTDRCQPRQIQSARHVQLKTFAEQSGLTLYSRAGGHYYVNEQGLSIGKSIYHLANLNSFAATACSAPDDWQHITIRIPMRYWGGGISQALMHAIGEVRRQYPAILYYCEFLDDYHDFQYRQRSWLPETRPLGSIDIRYTSAGADISGRWLALDNGHKIRHANWIVPKMPWGIMQTLAQDLETADIPYTYCDVDYTQKLAAPLPDGERLLVNELLLTEALRAPHHSEPFPQARRSGLHYIRRLPPSATTTSTAFTPKTSACAPGVSASARANGAILPPLPNTNASAAPPTASASPSQR